MVNANEGIFWDTDRGRTLIEKFLEIRVRPYPCSNQYRQFVVDVAA